MLYKSQILSYLESGVVAYVHAPATTMGPVDRIQRRFLRELGISNEQAMVEFNLAPLRVRREIAAFGLLHRRVLGLARPSIAELLPFDNSDDHGFFFFCFVCFYTTVTHATHTTSPPVHYTS